MRGQGRVYRPKVDGTICQKWWLDYTQGGQRHREPSGTTDRREAQRLLRERIGKREHGELVGRPDRVVFAVYAAGTDGQRHLTGGLRALVEQDYRLRGLRSLRRITQALANLEVFFGADAKAPAITTARLNAYAEHRLASGTSRATVNYEKAALRRAFRLAIKQGLLATMPSIETARVENRRSGFFDEGELAAVLLELPPDVRGLVQFLAATGWRRDEARLLPWAAVDWEGQVLRLEGARSKSGEPRVFPFRLAPALKALLEARWAARDGLCVFHRDGQPLGVGALRSAWARACKRAGLAGRLVHDLRRTAARDMRRAGLAESDIMELCGWETREMFKRYCIKDEHALELAVGRRFNGKVTAQSGPPVESGPLAS